MEIHNKETNTRYNIREQSVSKVKRCEYRNCKNRAEYYYHNKVSDYKIGFICRGCLKSLRHDISIEKWLELGFAVVL